MESIKILIPTHVTPDTKSIVTLFFENLLPILEQYVHVHVVWFVYQPERIKDLKKISDNITILDIHDYDNAVELLQKQKPDIIFTSATKAFVDYAISTAAKSLDIPTFSMFWSDWYFYTTSQIKYATLNISRFFQSSIPTDTDKDQKKPMRRGLFFLAKYLFLAKTQKAVRMNFAQIISNFCMLLKRSISDTATDSRFASTLHFLEDEKLQNTLVASGFDKSTLLVTGNPIFDKSLQKSSKQDNFFKQDGEKKILLAPSTLYEHGFWNQEQRDFAIKEIVKSIYQNDNMSITVKIHPSTSILSEYVSIINPIDTSIPVYQKGDIQEFLENIDLVITFLSSTTEVYAIIARKPVIICNFFQSEKDMLVKRGLAVECTDPSKLIESIEKALHNSEYEKKRDDFIREFLFKADGHASERICDAILKLLNKK